MVLGSESSIYFTVPGAGIKAYSLATGTVRTVLNKSLSFFQGIAYDQKRDGLYFADEFKIYYMNRDGSEGQYITYWNQCACFGIFF